SGSFLYLALAQTNEGFYQLNEFLTRANLNKKPFPESPSPLPDVVFIYEFDTKQPKQLLDNEYIGVRPHQINRYRASHNYSTSSKCLALYPVTLASGADLELHTYLRAIHFNTLITKVDPDTMGRETEVLQPEAHLAEIYNSSPELLEQSKTLLEKCSLKFNFSETKNKKTFTGNVLQDKKLLKKLAQEGLNKRYGMHNSIAQQRLEHELKVIYELGFSAYFLITWDIIRYSLSKGYQHVGRGSGANSIVAYCLYITDVDPIELNLYFERFINPKRTSPPDFDIDYSWKDRDDVQHYIFNRYPERHVALLGATTTFKDRSIIRELGKACGLPKEEIDDLVQSPHKAASGDTISQKLLEMGRKIMDFPNTRSIHAGGILISEEPITKYVALDMPPKGFPTTQWDMYVAELLRYEKLDILSQRGIGHINETVEIVEKNQGIIIDAHNVAAFKKDKKVNQRLYHGETNGCFYIESPAMRGLLKKLRCNNYLSLVAASSIIRPGVAKSGMMKEYIKRFHNPNNFTYLHPVMEEQLKETYGVMVYQEDVIKICHHFAGLDLSDADILRRAMAGKFRSKKEFARIREKYYSNCKEKGYSEDLAKEVWRQIESFAGYAFSKAHSASYAVESYQSLYLKTYYPLEFMVAVINNFGGFYRSWVYFNEARRCGANIHLPCVNRGDYKTSISGRDIFIGFVHVQNLENKIIERILRERNLNGPFQNLEEFIYRVPMGNEQIIILIRTNALRFTGMSKQELLWKAQMMINTSAVRNPMPSLFRPQARQFDLPVLETSALEDAYDEIELIGFPVSLSMFDMLETNFRGNIFAQDLMQHVGKTIRILGNLVTLKNVRTVKKEWMHFGCFLDLKGEFFDTVNFPPSLKNYPFRGNGIYLILGKVVEEFGFPSIEVQKMAKLPFKKDPRYG
ncbi:MAG: DNA polymerase III subunit alpha, partial [Bacteroidota bacterium]